MISSWSGYRGRSYRVFLTGSIPEFYLDQSNPKLHPTKGRGKVMINWKSNLLTTTTLIKWNEGERVWNDEQNDGCRGAASGTHSGESSHLSFFFLQLSNPCQPFWKRGLQPICCMRALHLQFKYTKKTLLLQSLWIKELLMFLRSFDWPNDNFCSCCNF